VKRTKLHKYSPIVALNVPGRTRTLGKAASVGGQRCPGKDLLCTLNPGTRQWRLLMMTVRGRGAA
jgi:hypothetical protein